MALVPTMSSRPVRALVEAERVGHPPAPAALPSRHSTRPSASVTTMICWAASAEGSSPSLSTGSTAASCDICRRRSNSATGSRIGAGPGPGRRPRPASAARTHRSPRGARRRNRRARPRPRAPPRGPWRGGARWRGVLGRPDGTVDRSVAHAALRSALFLGSCPSYAQRSVLDAPLFRLVSGHCNALQPLSLMARSRKAGRSGRWRLATGGSPVTRRGTTGCRRGFHRPPGATSARPGGASPWWPLPCASW